MEITTVISIVSMVGTVISTILAFKAKNETLRVKNEIIQIKNETLAIKNTTSTSIKNDGTNNGVQSSTVNGGVSINGK